MGKDRIIAKTEGKIVNKYTLVPVGAVIATAVVIIAVMSALGSEKERIKVLEVKFSVLEATCAEMKADIKTGFRNIDTKLDAMKP